MSRLGVGTGMLLAAIACAPSASAQDVTATARAIRNATVYLEITFHDENNPDNVCTPPSQGTGFIVSKGGGVITAAHLFNVPECAEFPLAKVQGRIGYLSSPEVPLAIASISPERDIAVLKLGARIEDYPLIEACYVDTPQLGTNLLAFGFPLGEDLSVLPVTFQGLSGQDGRWRMSSLFTYGMSGGPITDIAGRVIGIIKGGVRGAPAVQTATPLHWASDALPMAGAFSIDPCSALDGGSGPVVVATDIDSNAPTYRVEVLMTAVGLERQLIQDTFIHDFSNDASCSEGWSTQTHAACLPGNAEISSVSGPLVISAANDGRSWYELDPNRPNCASLIFGYSDRGLDILGNCRGNGWIRASYEIEGFADGNTSRREATSEAQIPVPAQGPATQIFDAPPTLLDGLNPDKVTWSYRVTIRDEEGAAVTQLSDGTPVSGKFGSKQESNGTVVVTVEP